MEVVVVHNGASIGAKNQCVGVARIIRKHGGATTGGVTQVEIKVRNRICLQLALLLIRLGVFRYIGPSGCAGIVWRSLFHGPVGALSKPQYVVTIQDNTYGEVGSAALAQCYQARQVIIRAPRFLSLDQFFMVVSPTDALPGSNVVNTPTAPDHILRDDVECALSRSSAYRGGRYWVFLVGGQCKGVPFDRRDFLDITYMMGYLSEKFGVKWLVSTSPRTGPEGSQIIERYALKSGNVEDFLVWPKRQDMLPAFLAAGDVCFVTEESVSMLSLCVTLGKPTYAYAPRVREHTAIGSADLLVENEKRIDHFLAGAISQRTIRRLLRREHELCDPIRDVSAYFNMLGPAETWEGKLEAKLAQLEVS